MIHTIKGFGIFNKAEINIFLGLSYFFDVPVCVGNLISGSSAFSKTSLNIWKFMVHVLLKPELETFEHYFTSIWDVDVGFVYLICLFSPQKDFFILVCQIYKLFANIPKGKAQ